MPEPRKRAPGAGRKRLVDGELSDVPVKIRVTASQFVRLQRAAGDEGVSAWGRGVLLAAAPSVLDEPEELRAAPERAKRP